MDWIASFPTIRRLLGRRSKLRVLLHRADIARDNQRYGEAANLYVAALQEKLGNGPIHVQCGHMLKEAG